MFSDMRPSLNRLLATQVLISLCLLASCGTKNEAKAARQHPAPPAVAPATEMLPATPTPTPVPVAQATPTPDPVPNTIAEAEKAYAAGQDESKAGHMDAAKQSFSRALDILTQGPVSMKSDGRLQQ